MKKLLAFLTLLAACAPAPAAGSTLISPIDDRMLHYVPAGEFAMGSNKLLDEQPIHTVKLAAFWIDETEVTNAMYGQCVQAGQCDEPTGNRYYADSDFAEHPITFVSWNDAADYCSYAGRRLPTEAEWEKAAGWDPVANAQRVYPWGNDFACSKANFDDETTLDAFVVEGGASCDGHDLSAPVGSYPEGASAYGALDMAGNVWEWVYDGFVEQDPYSDFPNYYSISPEADPTGPEVSAYRVVRGSSWNLNFGLGRVAYRLWFGPDDAYDGIGFRCALGTQPFKLNP